MTRLKRDPAAQLSLEGAQTFLLGLARARGLELEVFAQREQNTSVSALKGEVTQFQLSTQQGVALRVLRGGAWGESFTENLSEAALERALDRASENAELTVPESGAALVNWPPAPALDLSGEGLSGVTVAQKVAAALELDRVAAGADPRVISVPYGGYSDSVRDWQVANTGGLERSAQALSAITEVYPLLSESGQSKMDGDWQFTREFTQLDPTRTALVAVERAAALLGARPAPSGAFPVWISGRAMAELLGLFAPMFSGRMLEEGKSPLAGRVGEVIAAPGVTIVDDATLETGLLARPFDAEGCPSAPLTLVEGGLLQAVMHNQGTAARAGVDSTGHAKRYGLGGPVGVGHSNLFLRPHAPGGAAPPAAFSGIQLLGVSGGHAGANAVTGDFSLEASGFLVQDGERQHALDVFTVAGNFLDLLWDVRWVGADLHWTSLGTGAPDVLVGALSIAGQ
ncbi:TldD/PmbA family protein [Deinococcus soli (ex Cha et al. 2016)]|jgi:PmbA protein|uniref:PmbA protein n=2 Tax=Deinococcus soli (ex Cha et al. 2016) TaxID=1309411 RepID=A0AAE4BP06_9DEIO|nr:TldD/PmbA family protein [Deinococcus soli (ex Cha et al. 2016)]MDR6219724.1 PmbA protein [Deinococcus soli (ex Cha et al. 2016)]MDR6329676.1 PmbA protein [Deinococcus soli (ex Cha et al. 2016)]MDR6752631.1 PmbA protein [Deinococcus soli (ex Cha et al. 2016)]